MHVRISTFQVQPAKLSEAQASLGAANSQVANIPGLLQWFVAGDKNGQCTTVALYASQRDAEAAREQVGKLLSRFGNLLDSEPTSASYEVYHHHNSQ